MAAAKGAAVWLATVPAAAPTECLRNQVRVGANHCRNYTTCKLCKMRLSTTPKPGSFVGVAECVMSDDPGEGSAEARAKQDVEVQALIIAITSSETLAMTAEVEEMVATSRSKGGVGILDTGCRKTVAGASWLRTGTWLPRRVCAVRWEVRVR